MWAKTIAWCRANKVIAAAIVALSALVLISAAGAYHFRTRAVEAEKKEKAQAEEMKDLQREGELEREAFKTAIGATEPALKDAVLSVRKAGEGVREAKASLEEVEAGRREAWVPPAIDNGELVARFDRAIGRLR